MGKTGILKSYDQKISGFIDRNPGRDVRARSEESMRNLGRDIKRDVEREMSRERSCRVTPDRHHRWRIRLASGSKQAARATPTARSACFVPQSAMSKKTPRSFQCGNLTEVSVFSTVLSPFSVQLGRNSP